MHQNKKENIEMLLMSKKIWKTIGEENVIT